MANHVILTILSQLDYKVTYTKLKEVFELAGRVRKVDILLDKDNKSRGMATVSYEDASHAAQAICILLHCNCT